MPLLAFVAVAVAFYPVAISIRDESVYLTDAYILRAGTVYADVAHLSVIFGAPHAGHIAPIYPPGVGALLVPATLVGTHAVFVVNLVLQVFGFLLFRALLGTLGIRRGWGILYLLYPTLALYSRTLTSEVPSATFLTLAVYLYARSSYRWRVAAGVVLGLLGFLRFANPIPVALFTVAAIVSDLADQRAGVASRGALGRFPRALPLVLGVVPGGLLFVAFNLAVYGAPFGPYSHVGTFGLRYVPSHLATYAADLLGIWPLMLAAPFLYRGALKFEAMITTFGTLAIMSAWFYIDAVHGFAENVLTAPRLLLPVMPLWLLAYAGVLDQLFGTRRRRLAALAVAGSVGVVVLLGVAVAYQQRVAHAANVRRYIHGLLLPHSELLINDETSIFVGVAWGVPRFARVGDSDVASLRCPDARPLTVVYTAKGNPNDRSSLRMTTAAARLLQARPVAYRMVGGWNVEIWQRGACA